MNTADITELDWRFFRSWRTLEVYKVWSKMASSKACQEGFNREAFTDFSPAKSPMAGYAITLVVQPGQPEHPRKIPDGWTRFHACLASSSGPKVLVIQDLDKPHIKGTIVTEANVSLFQTVGCVGAIVDGASAELGQPKNSVFKILARSQSSDSTWAWPVRFNCPAEVFGCPIKPGQIIHADAEGFIVIPPDEIRPLIERLRFTTPRELAPQPGAQQQARSRAIARVLRQVNEAEKLLKHHKKAGPGGQALN